MDKCPYCKGRSVKRGFRYNAKGKTSVRKCIKCKRIFTPSAFLRMRYKDKTILRAVSLYKKGKSAAKVRDALAADKIKVSRWTIIKWAKKFK